MTAPKASTGCHTWLSLCCDSISSKSCKSSDEKTRGAAKRDTVRRPWQKYPDFRIVLVLMKAATHMAEHRAEARISIQALVGRIRLHLREQEPLELSAGQLLALDCGMPHDVEALEESAFLLTVSWPKGAAKP